MLPSKPGIVIGKTFDFRTLDDLAGISESELDVSVYADYLAMSRRSHGDILTCTGVTVRRNELQRVGGFGNRNVNAEDLDLWMRAAEHFKLANLPIVALHYRVHPNQVTRMQSAAQMRSVDMLRLRQLERLIPHAGAEETLLHLTLFDVARHLSVGDLQLTKSWLDRLLAANDAAGLYDVRRFRAFLAARWLNAAHRCSEAGTRAWKVWRSSQLAASGGGGFRLLMKKMLGDRG